MKWDHVYGYPPNIDKIDAAFHVKGKHGILFAYGGTIYNPSEVFLPHFIIEHECVHLRRQGVDPERWWELYIEVPSFRYEEELVAHVREYEVRRRGKDGKRYTKDALLLETARRLIAPFYEYGDAVTLQKARADILSRLSTGQ